jgi:hypothetical protein
LGAELAALDSDIQLHGAAIEGQVCETIAVKKPTGLAGGLPSMSSLNSYEFVWLTQRGDA